MMSFEMKKIYWSKVFLLISVFISFAAVILAFSALRKYRTDITQIPSKLRTSLIVTCFFNVIAILVCGIYAIYQTNGKNKRIKCSLILFPFAVVSMLMSGVVLAGDYPYIKSIDLMYLDGVSEVVCDQKDLADYDGIYYIGRRDCPPCQVFYRALQNLTERYCTHVFYYDTFEDRQNNANNMYRILAELSVDTVPLVFTVQEGEVTNIFVGDSIEIDLRNFLANC